jgi:hypothetical protein
MSEMENEDFLDQLYARKNEEPSSKREFTQRNRLTSDGHSNPHDLATCAHGQCDTNRNYVTNLKAWMDKGGLSAKGLANATRIDQSNINKSLNFKRSLASTARVAIESYLRRTLVPEQHRESFHLGVHPSTYDTQASVPNPPASGNISQQMRDAFIPAPKTSARMAAKPKPLGF